MADTYLMSDSQPTHARQLGDERSRVPPLNVVATVLQHGLRQRYLEDVDIVAWADLEIASTANPPTWVLDLSVPGRSQPAELGYILQTARPAPISDAVPYILGTL